MRLALLSLAMLGAACASPVVLGPGPGAQPIAGERFGATAEAAGVRATIVGEWRGDPSGLGYYVTPVSVTLENNSGGPIQLRYQAFSLTNQTGMTSVALAPFQIQRPGTSVAPGWGYYSYWVPPPYYQPYYHHHGWPPPPWAPWGDSYYWWYGYYGGYPFGWEPSLPTRDMLVKALPEGVLEEGGRVTGYVYFQRLRGEEGSPVRFQLSLTRPGETAEFGRIVIPLVVERG